MPPDRPLVTCLCPTYGRFHRLRDAVACFLLQTYTPRRLLILNDAPGPIALRAEAPRRRELIAWNGCMIEIRNTVTRHATLGHKRQAVLEAARSPLVAHWDDDDLYFPWHLSLLAQAHSAHDVACVKPRAAWWVLGPTWRLRVKGPKHNVFEGQMLFRRDRALELGGYPPLDSGQAKALLAAFKRAGELHTWNPPDERVSYCYRWADQLAHVSATGNSARGRETYKLVNADWGDEEETLLPNRAPMLWARTHLADQFRQIIRGIEAATDQPTAAAVQRALNGRRAA